MTGRATLIEIAVTMFVVGMYGCAITSMTSGQTLGQVNAIRAECDGKLEAGVYKTFYQRTECFNEGFMSIYSESKYLYQDLVHLSNVYRLAVAERVDKGEFTKTEAQVIMAELERIIATEEQKRVAYARAAQTQEAQNMWQVLLGLGVLNQSIQPLQRKPITCTQTGNMINCF